MKTYKGDDPELEVLYRLGVPLQWLGPGGKWATRSSNISPSRYVNNIYRIKPKEVSDE